MLTNVRTGAAFPSVDPAGEWLYFSGYHVDGWEVERIRFAPDAALRAPAPADRFDEHDASHVGPDRCRRFRRRRRRGRDGGRCRQTRPDAAAPSPPRASGTVGRHRVTGRGTDAGRQRYGWSDLPVTRRVRPATTHRCRRCIRGTGCRRSGSLWRPRRRRSEGVEVPRTEAARATRSEAAPRASTSSAGMPTRSGRRSSRRADGERATYRTSIGDWGTRPSA